MLRSACAQEEASSGDEHERLLGKSFIVDGRSILDSELYAWIPERMRQNESWWCIRQEVKDRVKDQEGKGKGEAGKLKDLQRQMEQSMGERMEVEAKIEKKKSKLEGLQRKSKSQEEAEKARSIISSLAKSEQKAKEHEERIGKLCGQINNLAEHLHSQEEENGPCAGQYRAALHDVCGPMLPWMYLAWAVHFVAMLLPVPTYYFFTQCAGEGDTYVEYSPWLWAPFVVWVSIKLLLEWKCFTYIVVPIIAYIKSYRFLNLIDVAFELWLPITFAKSLILNMDVWAQGLYLAKFIRRARDCQGQSKIQTAWEHAWDESLFYGFRPGSNLNFLAGLAFATLVLQQFVYLLRALPVPMKIWSIDYKCGSEPNGYTVPICCTRVWHADAVKTLSSSIRMVFIMDGQRRYAINRADHKLKLGLLGLQGESIANYFHILKMDMRLMFFDSIFVNLLQSCAKLQIQTSLWALYLFADGKNSNVDHRIDLFTLMLAHITSFMGFCSVLMDCLQIRDNRMKVRKEQENTMHTAAFREYDKLAMWERSVLAVLVLQCLFQALCLWKFLKSFQCDYALWNFAEGCVDLQGVA